MASSEIPDKQDERRGLGSPQLHEKTETFWSDMAEERGHFRPLEVSDSLSLSPLLFSPSSQEDIVHEAWTRRSGSNFDLNRNWPLTNERASSECRPLESAKWTLWMDPIDPARTSFASSLLPLLLYDRPSAVMPPPTPYNFYSLDKLSVKAESRGPKLAWISLAPGRHFKNDFLIEACPGDLGGIDMA